jgi:aspartate aminotransferase
VPFEVEDVAVTNGGFAAIAVALRALVEPGDEVLYLSPPWFFYEALILAAGGVPRRLRLDPPNFDLDLERLERSLTPRTRALILNTPHNPTGRIYGEDTLEGIARLLDEASRRNGRAIFLLADEAYNRIIYDGRSFFCPSAYYRHTLVLYTYGKTLLAPGERLGYVALSPRIPGREALREAIELAQFVTGFAFPNAVLQHAIRDLEALSIDIGALERRRNVLVGGLRVLGYEVVEPEGTFYVLVRSPEDDDRAFAASLAARDVYVLPGSVVELPGWVRLSLTASVDPLSEDESRRSAR